MIWDFAEKNKRKNVFGDFAYMLTVIDTTGMEFDDVLLFDFLTASTFISEYRVLASLGHSTWFDEEKDIGSFHAPWYMWFVAIWIVFLG